MDTQLRTDILREQGGRIAEIRFLHHPGASGVTDIVEKAIRGTARNSGLTIIDGMIVFSCDGLHVPFVVGHDALMELHKNIMRGTVCLMPSKDSFFDGISVVIA